MGTDPEPQPKTAIDHIKESYAQEKALDRRSFRAMIALATICVLVVVGPLGYLLWKQNNETHALTLLICENLAVHHREENEDKHYAIAVNQKTEVELIEDLAEAMGLDHIKRRRYVIIEPREEITPPTFCAGGSPSPSPTTVRPNPSPTSTTPLR